MNRLLFPFLVLLLFIISCGEDDPIIPINEDSTPNILLIIGDDIGKDAFPGYDIGATKPNMPNMDQLSSNGIIFENLWVNPVCAPTRSTILTGKYGFQTGVLNAEDASTISNSEKSLQAYLDENTNSAYAHAIIGKWHLSNNVNRINQLGIGYFAGILGGGVGDYFNWNLTENGETESTTEYTTSKLTDLAINWINDQSKPWFCWLAYNAAHTPFHLPPANTHSQGDLPTDESSIDADPLPYYMAMMESMDFEIGRLFENIDPSELENTVVIFIGDNGTPRSVVQSPYTRRQGKGSLYQGGINVPMIISGSQVSRIGQRESALINGTDLFSTIANLAGVEVDSYEQSEDFSPLLNSSTGGVREFVYSEALGETESNSGFAIRNSRYKLIQFDDGEQEFYDLQQDPYESSNLLDDPLTDEQAEALQLLINKALEIRG